MHKAHTHHHHTCQPSQQQPQTSQSRTGTATTANRADRRAVCTAPARPVCTLTHPCSHCNLLTHQGATHVITSPARNTQARAGSSGNHCRLLLPLSPFPKTLHLLLCLLLLLHSSDLSESSSSLSAAAAASLFLGAPGSSAVTPRPLFISSYMPRVKACVQ